MSSDRDARKLSAAGSGTGSTTGTGTQSPFSTVKEKRKDTDVLKERRASQGPKMNPSIPRTTSGEKKKLKDNGKEKVTTGIVTPITITPSGTITGGSVAGAGTSGSSGSGLAKSGENGQSATGTVNPTASSRLLTLNKDSLLSPTSPLSGRINDRRLSTSSPRGGNVVATLNFGGTVSVSTKLDTPADFIFQTIMGEFKEQSKRKIEEMMAFGIVSNAVITSRKIRSFSITHFSFSSGKTITFI